MLQKWKSIEWLHMVWVVGRKNLWDINNALCNRVISKPYKEEIERSHVYPGSTSNKSYEGQAVKQELTRGINWRSKTLCHVHNKGQTPQSPVMQDAHKALDKNKTEVRVFLRQTYPCVPKKWLHKEIIFLNNS